MANVLVTGGTGFIGANMIHALLKRGDTVHCPIRPASDLKRLQDVRDSIIFHTVDLSSPEDVAKLFKESQPAIVFHFAAAGANPSAIPSERDMVLGNVLITMNIANAALTTGATFINTGSSSEYGRKNHPMMEDERLEPNNLYGVCKAAGTLYTQHLAREKGAQAATLRIFSAYGYYEEDYRLMPKIVKAALAGEPFTAVSKTAVRDFVFIEDVIDAYLAAAEKIDTITGMVLNLGTGIQSTIEEVVAAAGKATGKKIQATYGTIPPKQLEPTHWVADMSLTAGALGWKARYSLEDGLTKYAAWYAANNS